VQDFDFEQGWRIASWCCSVAKTKHEVHVDMHEDKSCGCEDTSCGMASTVYLFHPSFYLFHFSLKNK